MKRSSSFSKPIKAYFPGIWHIDRLIEDMSGALLGSMRGLATILKEDKGQFLYSESLLHSLKEGESFNANQNYLFKIRDNTLKIYFPSRELGCNTLFLDLHFDAQMSAASASHLCGQDLYHATFHLIDDNHWKTEYRVEGPSKAYLIKSDFVRILL